MSDTPRTDAAVLATQKAWPNWQILVEHARQLERELAQARLDNENYAKLQTETLEVAWRLDCHFDGDWNRCDKEMCKREQLCRRRS
jgi:hypothetical protein